MKHRVYNIEELLKDRSFRNWVFKSNQTDIEHWNSYLLYYPEQMEMIQTASQMIQGITVKEEKLSVREINNSWTLLNDSIENSYKIRTFKKQSNNNYYWTSAAAVFVGLIACAIYFLPSRNKVNIITYATLKGEKKEIVLPDHSVVILNSNSSLVYQEPADGISARTVILEGEAFFSVVHTKDDRKFIVKTTDNLKVEVLGTKFNVSTKEKSTSVVLNSGKIRLDLENRDKSLLMEPGEMVLLEKNNETITRKRVNPEIYSAWKDNKLIFENNSLEEIKNVLEVTYGLELQVANKNLLQKRFTGTFQTDKLNVLFEALSNSFNLKYIRKENKVLLKPL